MEQREMQEFSFSDILEKERPLTIYGTSCLKVRLKVFLETCSPEIWQSQASKNWNPICQAG